MANFNNWLPFMSAAEGGAVFSNHANDYGGKTFHGVTLKTWEMLAPKILGIPGTEATLRKATAEQHAKIAKVGFWDTVGGDQIKSDAVAIAISDIIWHHGWAFRANIQQLLNAKFKAGLVVDGVFGNKTISAINSISPPALFEALNNWRRAWFRERARQDTTQLKWLQGWLNRVTNMEIYVKKKGYLLQA